MALDHLPLRVARLFSHFIFPCQLAPPPPKKKNQKTRGQHNVLLLLKQRFEPATSSPPLRARQGRGERFASLCVCVRVISLQAPTKKNAPISFLYISKNFFWALTDTQSLGQTTAGTPTDDTLDGRSTTGPRPTETGLGKNTLSRLQRRLPILSSSPASKRRLRQVVHWFTPATLSTM